MQTTGAPEPLRDAEVLEHFVHQHARPLDCIRELVQNSLDAGSEEVDIRVAFEPRMPATEDAADEPEQATRGFAELVVVDRGDGMGRGVIEGRLTTLFASVGDDEPNRIGRYGVGFASVFALDPELVIIDSSWRGEHWRIVFDRERRYTLRRRARAIFGTVVRVVIPATEDETDALRERAREATLRWCRHVEVPVRFEGEAISAPLEIDAPCSVTVRGEGEALVVAHPPRGESGSYGLYRAGLTLVEGDDERSPAFRGIAFKASSRQLDLTLTRDAVIHDVNYQRLIAKVRSTVETRLCERVFSMLEKRVWTTPPDDAEARAEHEALGEYLYDAAIWHIRQKHRLPAGVEDRAAFRSPAGLAIGVSAVHRALARRGVVYFEAERSPLTDALEDRGHLVIRMAPGSPEHRLLKALDPGERSVAVCERCCMPLPLADDALERWRPLTAAVAQLIVDGGGEITGVVAGHLDYHGSAVARDVAITQEHFGELSLLSEVRGRGRELLDRVQLLVVNADHPAVQTLATLAKSEPEFAAYQYIKLMFLGARLDPELDAAFAGMTVERRWRRRNR